MKQTLFMRQLGIYFETYLPDIHKSGPNTIAAYADSFVVLFRFFCEQKGIPHHLINYKNFTPAMFDEYLIWMERKQHYSEASKKHRLSAISSFLKYASRREMAALNALNSVSGTDAPKVSRSDFPYFSVNEVRILLALPDCKKRLGNRDIVLLSLFYESAARAQELCDLSVGDIRFGSPTKVKLCGKGKKMREVPISEEVSNLLRYYLKTTGLEGVNCHSKPLFSSQTHEKMTTACVRSITNKYVLIAKKAHPDLFNEIKYSPHSFRHSKAVHMVEAGTALINIRNFLGHSSIQSTEIYARVGQAAVTKALTERKIPRLAPQVDAKKEDSEHLPVFLTSLRQKNYVR
jgi:integrase/recombinase XerD